MGRLETETFGRRRLAAIRGLTQQELAAPIRRSKQTTSAWDTFLEPRRPSLYRPALAPDQPATLPTSRMVPVGDVRVGARHRRVLGDLAGLAASIENIGLLHPIVIRPDGELIAGERRLCAVESLGWKEVPVNVVDLDAVVRGECAENTCRKGFTLSEAVAIKRALEPLERAAAKERQREGGRAGGQASGKLPQALKGRAADKAAKATGMARRTLEKAEAIVDAAEAAPERFGNLLADMDRTGRVNGVYRRLKIAKQAELICAEPPPLPGNGPYRVAVVDPPWPYEQCAVQPYPTLSVGQICELPVPTVTHADSILWLWTTNYYMRHAFEVLDAWGFAAKTILTWAKDRMGIGEWMRGQTEHCILAVRGSPTVTLSNQTTLLRAPVRGHSVKPIEFYDLVESLCPAPRYADLFSRYQHNEKWDCHGDEAPLKAPLQNQIVSSTHNLKVPSAGTDHDLSSSLRRAAQ